MICISGVFSVQLSPAGAANSTSSPLAPRAINGAIPNLSAETHPPVGSHCTRPAAAVELASPGKTAGLLTDAGSLALFREMLLWGEKQQHLMEISLLLFISLNRFLCNHQRCMCLITEFSEETGRVCI